MTLASKVLLASIPILINLYATRYREQDKARSFPNDPPDLNLPVEEVFDFIIVGGGTAGCITARRLSDEGFSVLVLEAGGNPPPLQSVPVLLTFTQSLPDINFLYRTVPQKNAFLNKQGIIDVTTGKMMGGSSSHNNMLYERGHPDTFNDYADITGDPSWRYENLVKYFLKAENYSGEFSMNKKHHIGGPLTITQPNYTPGQDIWLQAGREQNFEVNDPNGPQTVGFSPNEFFKKFGRRVTTYSAYIKPIEKNRKNLTIRRYAMANKILFEGKTATGVLYKHHGIPRVARASKEVIVSAGTYRNCVLLINSGIGPIDQLQAINVSPIAVLPVGYNLMDHPLLEISPIFVSDESKSWKIDRNLTFDDIRTFLKHGEGPLTSSYSIAETHFATSRARLVDKKPEWPDTQILYDYIQQTPPNRTKVTPLVALTRPQSRGRVTLNTTVTDMDNDYAVIVDFNFYSQKSDFDVTIEGIDFVLKTIETTQAFKSIGAHLGKKPIKECQAEKFRSRAYWMCYIRQMTMIYNHGTGTCRMGKANDPRSVVNSKLKVIGLERLRVVDGSIFPEIPNSNTVAPVIMVAEKAASEIINEYKKKNSSR